MAIQKYLPLVLPVILPVLAEAQQADTLHYPEENISEIFNN